MGTQGKPDARSGMDAGVAVHVAVQVGRGVSLAVEVAVPVSSVSGVGVGEKECVAVDDGSGVAVWVAVAAGSTVAVDDEPGGVDVERRVAVADPVDVGTVWTVATSLGAVVPGCAGRAVGVVVSTVGKASVGVGEGPRVGTVWRDGFCPGAAQAAPERDARTLALPTRSANSHFPDRKPGFPFIITYPLAHLTRSAVAVPGSRIL